MAGNRAPLFGGDWDLPSRYAIALMQMNSDLESDIGVQLDNDRNMHIYNTFVPAETWGLGLPYVGDFPDGDEHHPHLLGFYAAGNAPYLQFQTAGNILRICVRQRAPGIVIAFPQSIVGSAIIRTVEHIFIRSRGEAEDNGFQGAFGVTDLATSNDSSELRYVPSNGDAARVSEGSLLVLQGGNLFTEAAITGVYNIEFFNMSGRPSDVLKLFVQHSSEIDSMTKMLNQMPQTIVDIIIRFIFAIGNGNVLNPIEQAQSIIYAYVPEREIRDLALIIGAMKAMIS